jgi:16S rRNA (guanine966-N2)-methyltransferase
VRIVAGSARGVRLAPVPPGVRPVSDAAREGLFSSIAEHVPGARVLDLYAGTGAMAIEALSRGAEHAVLVDRDRITVRTIRENLGRAKVGDRAEVVTSDVLSFVRSHDNRGAASDLVFADPPYAIGEAELEAVLAALGSGGPAEGPRRVVLTRPKKSSTLVIPVHWRLARRLTYGDTLVLIFQEA